jgi:hypothetical protein
VRRIWRGYHVRHTIADLIASYAFGGGRSLTPSGDSVDTKSTVFPDDGDESSSFAEDDNLVSL